LDTNTLTEQLRALDPGALDWTFALYNAHRYRDGIELEWSTCRMRGIIAQVDKLREYLLKKPVDEKPVVPYSPFLPDKETIGALELTDEIIREQIKAITIDAPRGPVYTPEDFLSGTAQKPTGYALYGESKDENSAVREQVLFMRRANPFLSPSNAALFTSAADEFTPCEKPILKFAPGTDFLLIGGVCYFFSSSVEKDFALESRQYAIAQKRMESIAAAEIINDYDNLEACVMKPRNARKFMDFDKAVLDHIVRLPIVEREEFLGTYGVTIDRNGYVDTSDPAQCELVVDLLCCKSCLDPLGRLSVGSNITRRE
jgi:hypothetical protein